jgi:hypothetical protein
MTPNSHDAMQCVGFSIVQAGREATNSSYCVVPAEHLSAQVCSWKPWTVRLAQGATALLVHSFSAWAMMMCLPRKSTVTSSMAVHTRHPWTITINVTNDWRSLHYWVGSAAM